MATAYNLSNQAKVMPQDMDNDPLAVEVCKRQERLERERSIYESTWRDIALRVMPQEEQYFNEAAGSFGAGKDLATARLNNNVRKDAVQFDSYPTQALDKYAAAIHQYCMPASQKWVKFKPQNKSLEKSVRVQRYLEDYREGVFDIFYSGDSLLDHTAHMSFMSSGLYGNGYSYIEDRLAKGVGYQACHASTMFPIEDGFGRITGMHRRYTRQASQFKNLYQGRMARIPNKILVDAANPQTENKVYTIIQCVYTNEMQVKNIPGLRGMQYVAYDVCLETKTVILTSGYKSFPFAISRHLTLPGSVYSLSPAFLCLADIKTLNEMMKTNIRYAQLTTDPPIMLADADSLRAFGMRPGFLNYGYLDADGKPTAVPFQLGGDPRFAEEMMKQKQSAIAASFYNTLFDILVETPEMTATQALIRSQEKGAMLAPVVSRQGPEMLNVYVRRTAEIMETNGGAPEPPQELIDAGGGVRIEYDSPITRALKSEEGAGIIQTSQVALQYQSVAPETKFRFNYDEALQKLARIYSCPASVIRSDEEYQEVLQQEQQRIDQAQQAQTAMGATEGIKNLAQAQAATGRNQGQAQAA